MSKLLIVDDESAIRTLIVKYATYEGYEVEEAENGMQAVEKCKKEDYSLVILDIMMPELDGFSAGREIKKLHPNLPGERNTTGSTALRSGQTIMWSSPFLPRN